MLINCVAYEGGKKLADIQPSEIHGYVCRPECFVWVALFEPTRDELDAMHKQFDLPGLAVEDAFNGHQRPKIEEYGDTLFAPCCRSSRWRTRTSASAKSMCSSAATMSFRCATALSRASWACAPAANASPNCCGTARVTFFTPSPTRWWTATFRFWMHWNPNSSRIETRIFAGQNNRAIIEALYSLKQQLMTLKHATSPLLEAIGKLYGGRVPYQCSRLQEYFRDIYDHLVRLNQSIESLREMVTTAITVNLSLLTIQESEVTKRLASYAALVAVPTMIAGVYGMNFKHMPELDWFIGYPLAVGMMAAIDCYLFYRFRKSKWL